MEKYNCPKCKYVYDENNEPVKFDELPETWSCPFCFCQKKDFIIQKPDLEVEDKRVWVSDNNPSIARIKEKCINCGVCKNICQNIVGIKYKRESVTEPICINCGQCVLNCPVAALVPKYDYKEVLNYLNDTDYTIICSVAPAVRVSIGEEFGYEPGSIVIEQLVSSLKELKFDYVFDLTFGADLTIMEEATELVSRIENNQLLPQFTSCCPAWVKYAEIYHQELLDNLSTAKSPISMQGVIIKNYFAKLKNINPEKIINVMISPCTAKKYEIKREELPGMDFVLTTRELSMMLRECNIDLKNSPKSSFDPIISEGSGAGTIFGSSGGVMEAALRTAYHIITKENPPENLLNLEPVRGEKNIKEATIKIGDRMIKVAAVYGMPNLEKILANKDQYRFIEVMNCPGGCIGGGGQPLTVNSMQQKYRELRSKGLYKIDKERKIRTSYSNEDIIQLYKVFLNYPGSEKAKSILHTKYQKEK